MTREKYLSELKNNLYSLSQEEKAEALQYYSDYFEEANDDQKVINELGSPQELAKSIIEKFATALIKAESKNKENEDNEKSNEYNYARIYCTFPANEIKNLHIKIGAAQVVLIANNTDFYSVETRGLNQNDLECKKDKEGSLYIENKNHLRFLNFFNHNRSSKLIPRILISIPKNSKVNNINISIGAGNLKTEELNLNFNTAKFDVGAGNISIKEFLGGRIFAKCAMGNMEYTGKITGESFIDCGMGNMLFNLKGDISQYSYNCKVGLGKVKINEESDSGISKYFSSNKKENHLSVNCGMGNVTFNIK